MDVLGDGCLWGNHFGRPQAHRMLGQPKGSLVGTPVVRQGARALSVVRPGPKYGNGNGFSLFRSVWAWLHPAWATPSSALHLYKRQTLFPGLYNSGDGRSG